MSATLPLSKPHAIGESDGHKDSQRKIKAPFVLTSMNHPRKPLLMWVWSRRGKRWQVDQELRFDSVSKCDKSGS